MGWRDWIVAGAVMVGAGCAGEPASFDASVRDATAPVDGAETDAARADTGSPLDGALLPGWRDEPDVPVPIQEIAGAVHQGLLVIAGGFDAGLQVVTTVRTYDPATGVWAELPALPAPRHHVGLISTGDDLYLLGGMETTAFEPLDTAWVLRDGASAWVPIAPLPQARAAGVVGHVDGRLYLVGGQTDRGLARAVLIYDLLADAWSVGADIPEPREHIGGFTHDDEVWVVAGRMGSLNSNTTRVDVYDPVADAWREGPAIPTARGGHGVARLGDFAYAVGGEQPDRALDAVEVLDLTTSTWATSTPVPTPRHGHVVLAAAGRVFVIGGADRPIFAAVSAVESYAP